MLLGDKFCPSRSRSPICAQRLLPPGLSFGDFCLLTPADSAPSPCPGPPGTPRASRPHLKADCHVRGPKGVSASSLLITGSGPRSEGDLGQEVQGLDSISAVLLAGSPARSPGDMGAATGGGSRASSPTWRPSRGRWQALECTTSCCPLPLQPVTHFRQG